MTYKAIIQKYLPNKAASELSTNLILVAITPDELVELCQNLYHTHRLPLKAITATDERAEHGIFKVLYLFGIPGESYFLTPYIQVKADSPQFPSLVATIHEATYYEREIHSLFGLMPTGHPDLRPLILQENWPEQVFPLRKDFAWDKRPPQAHGVYQFQRVDGEGIYEIPVGPVHAGIIGPGHFRFSVAGEEILKLEPQLGYVHKGIEKLFEQYSLPRQIELAEQVAGDSSFSHALSFCQAVETLVGLKVSKRAQYLRVIYAELERLANHSNDIGFILNDTAFAFGGSQGTRMREIVMQCCERLTGSRFLRGVATIGGVTKDITPQAGEELARTLQLLRQDFEELITITESSATVMNRLQTTGVLSKQVASDHGVIGVAARATGIATDSRVDYPYAAYADLGIKIAKQTTGDVYARYRIRAIEVFGAIDLIIRALGDLPDGPITGTMPSSLPKSAYALGITEGWRGDIVYLVATDKHGHISRVSVRDPSFLNWPAVPYAVAGNIVPDFPLINKSFNLSYSGFDR